MATLQEVLMHITGHSVGIPRQISWQGNFTRVQNSLQGNADAYTSVDFRPTYRYSSRPDRSGKHRLTNVRVTVDINRNRSWYVSGRDTTLLLRHEQGHYSITFLVARNLCRRLLELEWDSAVLTAIGESSPAQITTRLRTDANQLSRTAQSESTRLNRLYDDPVRGAKNADGSINQAAQIRWDQMINHSIQYDTELSLLILISGGNPRNW